MMMIGFLKVKVTRGQKVDFMVPVAKTLINVIACGPGMIMV